jgi:hypothetical protein
MNTATRWLPVGALLMLLAGCGHEGNSTSAIDQNATDKAQDAAMISPDAAADEAMANEPAAAVPGSGAPMNQADADTAGGASNVGAGAMGR